MFGALPRDSGSCLFFVGVALSLTQERGELIPRSLCTMMKLARRGLFRGVGSRARQLSSGKVIDEQLGSFPEYAKAQSLQLEGSYKLVLPELERVHDVLSHSMGNSSPMTLHVVRQMSEAARLSGKTDKALDILTSALSHVSSDSPDRVALVALRSYQYMVGGDSLKRSLEDAEEAVRICESFEGMHPDYFGISYGLVGVVCSMNDSNSCLAEEYLQLAARWSQEPTAELCALNNLGHYHLYRREGGEEDGDYRMAVVKGKKLWGADPGDGGSEEGGKELGEGRKEALAYWDEAVDAYKEEGNMLSNVDYAISYAGVLAASSQGLRVSDPSRSSELLASALKAIDGHKANPRARPMLGRILNLIAFNNMSASMAVTAEGLFRSSLDHLGAGSAHAANDTRYRYEHALALGGYSVLTSKWEKREQDAADLNKQSCSILEELSAGEAGVDGLPGPFPFLFPDIAKV